MGRQQSNYWRMPANLVSLLYVSEATSGLGEDEVEAIVEVALARNGDLNVTGSLVFTGPHFAQVLEGPKESEDELMASIEGDDRHRNIYVIECIQIPACRFPDWRLAYAGPSLFVDRHLRPLVERQASSGRQAVMSRQLIALMREFATSRTHVA